MDKGDQEPEQEEPERVIPRRSDDGFRGRGDDRDRREDVMGAGKGFDKRSHVIGRGRCAAPRTRV